MENTNIVLAGNIQKYRKKCSLTQEALAEKLGVTFQAVSKWENARSAPDITLLPALADLFGCYIDELFSREVRTERHFDHCSALPWADDLIIRGVVCEGRKILKVSDNITNKFTFEVIGDAKQVKSECNVSVSGGVSGGCAAGNNVSIEGNVSGGVNAGNNVSVQGSFSGGCNCGNNFTCGGDHSGGINCGNTVKVSGDVEAEKIKGNVTCRTLKCEHVQGSVTILGDKQEKRNFTSVFDNIKK